MKIKKIDHLVLTVKNISQTILFYTKVLEMKEETFEDDRKALRFGDQKINLHQAGAEYKPHSKHPTPGSSDFCFIASESIDNVVEQLKYFNVKIINGPVKRIGAGGALMSVYFNDPDGNLIEVSNYLES